MELESQIVPGRSGMGKSLAVRTYYPRSAVTYYVEREFRLVAVIQMPSPSCMRASRKGLPSSDIDPDAFKPL